MKINRAPTLSGIPAARAVLSVIALGALGSLAGCVAPAVQAPAPSAPVAAPTRPVTPPPVAAPPPRDWRDAPQTPGTWQYQSRPAGGESRYVSPTGDVLFRMQCDGPRRQMTLSRAGWAQGPLPLSLVTSSEVRPLSASPAGAASNAAGAVPTLDVVLPASDRVLDAMAFSRGRFAVEVNGLPTLYLPAWPEVARTIEDCR